jgi:3-dehydroquinate dehydratase
MKFTKSGTRYSLVGDSIPTDTVVEVVLSAREKIEAFRRNRDISNVARKVLGFTNLEHSEDFRNLSVRQVKEALEQAYEHGKQSKR